MMSAELRDSGYEQCSSARESDTTETTLGSSCASSVEYLDLCSSTYDEILEVDLSSSAKTDHYDTLEEYKRTLTQGKKPIQAVKPITYACDGTQAPELPQNHPQKEKPHDDNLLKSRQSGKRSYLIGFGILLLVIVISGIVAAVVFILHVSEKDKSNQETQVQNSSLDSTTISTTIHAEPPDVTSPVTDKLTVETTTPKTTPTTTPAEPPDVTFLVTDKPTTTPKATHTTTPAEPLDVTSLVTDKLTVETITPKTTPISTQVTGLHRDCKELLAYGSTSDGVYTIHPYLPTTTAVRVYCDMTTDGGGWTTFQHRRDGSVEFYLLWDSYKIGFGEASGEYWLGNDHLHQLTLLGTSDFYVRLEKFTGGWAFAKYNELTVANETDGYRLRVKFNSYQGNAGDCFQSHLTINSQGYKFSTPDVDNDFASSSCAIAHRGAWWYNECSLANLNGYYNYPNCGAYRYCNFWYSLTNSYVNVKTSYMMVRRV